MSRSISRKSITARSNRLAKKISKPLSSKAKLVSKKVSSLKKKAKRELPKLVKRSAKKFIKQVKRNPREAIAATLLITILLGSFGGSNTALGATYTFNQTDWSGGVTSNTASHPGNQSNWNQFSSSTNISVANGGQDLNLSLSTSTLTQTDDSTTNTGFNFTGNTKSQTVVIGTSTNAKIEILSEMSWNATSTHFDSYYTKVGMALDDTYLYTVLKNSGSQVILQKRSRYDGSFVSGFGTNGVVSTAYYSNFSIVIRDGSLYLIGITSSNCGKSCGMIYNIVVEKRDVSTGALISGFGTSGKKTILLGYNVPQLSLLSEADSSGIYIATNKGTLEWNLRKIDYSGNAISSFGASGIVTQTFASSSPLHALDLEDGYLYLGGGETGSFGNRWRVEKRSATDGSLVSGFGTDGVLTVDPTSLQSREDWIECGGGNSYSQEKVCGLDVSNGYVYLLGNENVSGNVAASTWRVEKRSATDGSLVSGFGTNGVLQIIGASQRDSSSITEGGGNLYISGYSGSFSQIRSYSSTSGSINSGFGTSGVASPGLVGFIAQEYSSGYIYLTSKGGNSYFRDFKMNGTSGAITGASYAGSGTYTSGILDLSTTITWGRLLYTASTTTGRTISIKVRSSNDSGMSGATDWSSCGVVSASSSLSSGNCVSNGHRYIQYQASFSTNSTAVSPTLDSLSIEYTRYNSSGSLISSIFNSNDPTNIMGGVSWTEDASLPTGSGVTVSVRSASTDTGIASALWSDITSVGSGCTKNASTVSCDNSSLAAGMKSSGTNQYFQYKVALTSNGSATPTIGSVSVYYVVNAPPQFNPDYPSAGGGGVDSFQVSDPADPNLGKVKISYSVRDTDSTTGTNSPGFITPSFEYDSGSGWVSIASSSLSSGSLDNKAVDQATYTTYSAIWNAGSQLTDTFSTNIRVRVKANDNEAANNIASSTSAAFTVDTKNPVINSFKLNSSDDTIQLNISDNSNIEYRISNSPDFSGDWVSVGTSSVSTTTAWSMPGGDSTETVYIQIRDSFGNTISREAVAPSVPANFDLKDVSNVRTGEYRLFLAWKVYSNESGATFSKYEVHRSTDNTNFSLLNSITNSSQNFYTDSDVSSSTVYYYKIVTVDSDSDRSGFSTVLSDRPDGQGGTDFTAPTITNIQVAETQASWVKITWTTDEIANSKIEYGPADAPFSLTETSSALVKDHSVVIDGLSPNTQYGFRVKSADIMNNEAISGDDAFTTAGGAAISAVAVKNTETDSVTITWNTDRSASSFVVYSTSIADLGSGSGNQAGSASFVSGPPFQHEVTINGLEAETMYYFYVKSVDATSTEESTDTNGGSYYYFTTTNDSKPPTIIEVSAPVVTPNSASIFWKTSELANSQVEYGTTREDYTNSTVLDSVMSIYHTQSLSGLTPDTTYYYTVKSADHEGNIAISDEQSFKTAKESETVTITVGSGTGAQLDTTPPSISGVQVEDIGAFGATIRFTASEPVVASVQFSQDESYDSGITAMDFKENHSVKLFGLKTGKKYNFFVKVVDKGGNEASSEIQSFSTKFVSEALQDLVTIDNVEQFQSQIESLIESTLPSLVPPVISEIETKNITESSAEVYWATNVKTFGSVAISADDEYVVEKPDVYTTEISDTQEKTKTHKVALTNLKPGTKYVFQARSFVLPGVVGKSKNYFFATLASKLKAEAVKVMNNSFTISWDTPTETSSFVEYRNVKTGQVGQIGTEDKVKRHVVEVKNVSPNTTYSVRAFGYDSKGILVDGDRVSLTTKRDAAAPVISGLAINSAFIPYRANQLQTVISWKTDEPSDSTVYYEEGIGTSEKLANTSTQKEMVTQHVIVVPGFKPSTVYRIKIASTDEAGNLAETPIRTIITPGSNESVFDVIIKNFEDAFGFMKNIGN